MQLSGEQLGQWNEDGYLIVRGLWSAEEVAACKAHFDGIARGQRIENHWLPDLEASDPLKRYPRVMHPHVFSDLSKRMMLDARIGKILEQLMGEEPIATQSMFYYKPPGGKGQALHQDNYYLQVRPKSCVAAWTAIDRSYPDNGGLYVCPGTHMYEVKCPELANPEESFTTHFVRPPDGTEPVPAVLEPGDVLFFNGSVVHGSKPNSSKDWRRSLICHYVPISTESMSDYYASKLRFNGSTFEIAPTEGGGPCGTEFPDGFVPFDWNKAKELGMKPVLRGSIPE
jgi:ectoine hydroxylase-related dioxygenase (phytanoyl-CoA dioxygenase family)